jgi:hypothetical protein
MRKTPRPKVSEIHEISNSGGDRISAPRQVREKPESQKQSAPSLFVQSFREGRVI